jgi:hypothetical protein
MQPTTSDLERPMLRMGSVAFLAGLVIIIMSTLFHASSEDLMDNPVVFEVYAESNTWIAAHIGQFAGVMLVFAGGFVALFRLLVGSESGTTASALAWLGLVAAILTKHNTNFNISISVRSLCVHIHVLPSRSPFLLISKAALTSLYLVEHFEGY